jgi:hypothetical protein
MVVCGRGVSALDTAVDVGLLNVTWRSRKRRSRPEPEFGLRKLRRQQ